MNWNVTYWVWNHSEVAHMSDQSQNKIKFTLTWKVKMFHMEWNEGLPCFALIVVIKFSFQCSVTCGKGIQRRTLNCAEKYLTGKYRELAPKKCSYLQKPNIEMEKVCILHPCYKHSVYLSINQGSWFSSSWSQVKDIGNSEIF